MSSKAFLVHAVYGVYENISVNHPRWREAMNDIPRFSPGEGTFGTMINSSGKENDAVNEAGVHGVDNVPGF